LHASCGAARSRRAAYTGAGDCADPFGLRLVILHTLACGKLIANEAPPPLRCVLLGRGGGYSQSLLLKRTALVAGALTATVLTAGLFPLSLVEWRWPPGCRRGHDLAGLSYGFY